MSIMITNSKLIDNKILLKLNEFVTNMFYLHFARKSSLKSLKSPRMKCLWLDSSRRRE